MTKTKTTLTIEKDLLEKAKQQIPNISEFLENCLKYYMGLRDGTVPTADTKDIMDEIGKLQAKLFILNQNIDIEENIKNAEAEKINRPFRGLWFEYRKNPIMNPELTQEMLNLVPVDEETLEDILDYLYVNQHKYGLNVEWETVYRDYQQEERENNEYPQ